ncbi:unnamed protein product [Dovyalis caffra]|uniref:Uncharacterized protein n=1 Tax=Dovyalis caffra TaxID=77055 RepID=A0AAV1RZE1_9ROSI|nr:unnamed protein product [Dovyalis caffra]
MVQFHHGYLMREKITRLDIEGNDFTRYKCHYNSQLLIGFLIFEILQSFKEYTFLSLSNQTNLDHLDLSDNELTGTIPMWLVGMKIGSITFSGNDLAGSLSPRLFQSRNLWFLSLSRNFFTGQLPDNIDETPRLNVLIPSENNFSGSIPRSIFNLFDLASLDLSCKGFSSNKFPNLSLALIPIYVDLSSNRLSGEIPLDIAMTMRVFVLSQNELYGFCAIPQNSIDSSDLMYLDLHNNKIIGEILEILFRISSLQVLNLRNNSLKGSIPTHLSNLRNLQILRLTTNLVGKSHLGLGNLTGMINNHATDSILFIWLSDLQEFSALDVIWKKFNQYLVNL